MSKASDSLVSTTAPKPDLSDPAYLSWLAGSFEEQGVPMNDALKKHLSVPVSPPVSTIVPQPDLNDPAYLSWLADALQSQGVPINGVLASFAPSSLVPPRSPERNAAFSIRGGRQRRGASVWVEVEDLEFLDPLRVFFEIPIVGEWIGAARDSVVSWLGFVDDTLPVEERLPIPVLEVGVYGSYIWDPGREPRLDKSQALVRTRNGWAPNLPPEFSRIGNVIFISGTFMIEIGLIGFFKDPFNSNPFNFLRLEVDIAVSQWMDGRGEVWFGRTARVRRDKLVDILAIATLNPVVIAVIDGLQRSLDVNQPPAVIGPWRILESGPRAV